MNCPKCGAPNQDNISFCPNCGAPMQQQAPPQPPPVQSQGQPTAPVMSAPPGGDQLVPVNNGLATTSLVLGICSLFCSLLAGIPAIIFGAVAINQINNSQGRQTGKGLAIAGIVIPLATLPIIMIMAAIMFPVFGKAREKARQSKCMNNQRQICLAMAIYAQDHNEVMPAAATVWNDIALDQGTLMCPTRMNQHNGYGYNSQLSGRPIGRIADPVMTMATADGGDANNLINSASDIDGTRHAGRFISSYVDGHVSMDSPNVSPQLTP